MYTLTNVLAKPFRVRWRETYSLFRLFVKIDENMQIQIKIRWYDTPHGHQWVQPWRSHSVRCWDFSSRMSHPIIFLVKKCHNFPRKIASSCYGRRTFFPPATWSKTLLQVAWILLLWQRWLWYFHENTIISNQMPSRTPYQCTITCTYMK